MIEEGDLGGHALFDLVLMAGQDFQFVAESISGRERHLIVFLEAGRDGGGEKGVVSLADEVLGMIFEESCAGPSRGNNVTLCILDPECDVGESFKETRGDLTWSKFSGEVLKLFFWGLRIGERDCGVLR